jgi:hypothetical protein
MKEEIVKRFILDTERDNNHFHTIGPDIRITDVITPGHSHSFNDSYTISYEVYRESLLGKFTFRGFKKEKGWHGSYINITTDRMKEIESHYLSETRELKLNTLLNV